MKHEQLRRLRAMKVIQMRVMGDKINQIAATLQVSRDTVERDLKYAEKANLFVDLEHKLLHDLAPAAIVAIKSALDDGDAETAIEVLKSLGIMKDPKAPKTAVESNQSDDLAKAIEAARERRLLEDATHDGEVVRVQLGRTNLAGLLADSNPPAEETVRPDSVGGEIVGNSTETSTGNS
jgi:hypothetical protein